MNNLNNILNRIKKNPETLHIKGYRFLKKKYYQLQAKKIEAQSPMSNEEFIAKTGFKGKENINDNLLFTNEQIQDKLTIQNAEDILKGKYELLSKSYILTEINWHKDFNSGKVWEKKHFSTIEYDNEGDKKIPWELNKCQHFVTLALAYKQTNDKKFFEEFKKQFLNWIKENPYEIGINWVTPMECAIRSINWIQTYQLFKEEFDENLTIELAKQLYLHGKYIHNNLEWSPAKENHYLTDCMGLFFISLFFQGIENTESWKIFAKNELEKEMFIQVSQDGVDYEASLNYHRLVTEIFLLIYILASKNNIQFSDSFKKRLENMHDFIMYYTSPSGKAPSFGDTDNGRVLHIWNLDTNDHRDLLSIASFYFKRADFKAKGKYHERMKLILSKKDYDTIEIDDKELQSKSFTNWFIMRGKETFLMLHCGDIGRNGFGGHGHNDQLSFVFSSKNKDIIIHPGTYCYTSDKKTRHLFRSTAYHNTLYVDNKEQNTIKEETPFNMENKTRASIFQWQTDKTQDIFIGKHFGYSPNIISREVHYDKIKKIITITDHLKSEADIEFNIHLHPETEIQLDKNKITLNKETCIEFETEPIISKTLYSKEYGHLSKTNKITIKKRGNSLITKIHLIKKEESNKTKVQTKKPKEIKSINIDEEYY